MIGAREVWWFGAVFRVKRGSKKREGEMVGKRGGFWTNGRYGTN